MKAGKVAIVAGSGLDLRPLLDDLYAERCFSDFPGLAAANTAGHSGMFLIGRHAGRDVIVQCGRLHAYEGLGIRALGRTVDALALLGAHTTVFTNAAGGLRPEAAPGTLVAAEAVWCWPYRAASLPPMLRPSCTLDGCALRGTYVWMHGPCYETRAEVRLLAAWGATTVGMSTAPELVRCEAIGMRTAVVSCVTNNCLRPSKLTHGHVLDAAKRTSERLRELLARNLPALAEG